MATHGAKVNINVPSAKKKKPQNTSDEEKDFLRKETIVVSPSDSYYYEFEFTRGEELEGKISSTSPIDTYFVDDSNFDKWNRGKSFEMEDSNEAVLDTMIYYLVPSRGTWYVIIENNGRKTAKVNVKLY